MHENEWTSFIEKSMADWKLDISSGFRSSYLFYSQLERAILEPRPSKHSFEEKENLIKTKIAADNISAYLYGLEFRSKFQLVSNRCTC